VAWPGTPPGYFFTQPDCHEIAQADVLVRPGNATFAKDFSFHHAGSVPHHVLSVRGLDPGLRSGRATSPPDDTTSRPVAQRSKAPRAVRGPPSS
jgi:hypothetical protein